MILARFQSSRALCDWPLYTIYVAMSWDSYNPSGDRIDLEKVPKIGTFTAGNRRVNNILQNVDSRQGPIISGDQRTGEVKKRVKPAVPPDGGVQTSFLIPNSSHTIFSLLACESFVFELFNQSTP